jgi:hypothetical protein
MLRTRREILSIFQSSTFHTHMALVSEGAKESHRITIESTRVTENNTEGEPVNFQAVLLVRSSQWYRYRLNVFGQHQGIEFVVCGKHDSCLPVQVWSVEEARLYEAGETTTPLSRLADPQVRGTKYGSLLFVAALLSEKREAIDLLSDKDFPLSTRYRYEAKVRYYANLRPGVKLSLV